MFGSFLVILGASAIGMKPEFRTPFVNETVEAGKWAILVCIADGERPMTYKWYNQGEDEMTEDDKQLVYAREWINGSSLVFRNLSTEHEGLYTCTASNAHGLASMVFFLRVPPPNGTAPFFRTPFENVTLAAGRWVHLLCKAEGEKSMTYKWYNQDKKEMKEDDKQPVYVRSWENDSSLVFRNLSSEQEGLYTCTASNTHGLASKVYSLTVTTPNGTAPFFRTPFENVTREAGRSLLLLCKAEGEKPMTYKWYNQDEKEMKEDDTQLVYVRNWENDSSLVLRNLSNEQEGLYTCTASNAYGLASKVYSLKVTPPNGTAPFFRTPFENKTLEAGRSLLLLCEAEGEKPMTYKWYNQDEKEIKEDDTQLVYVRNWENDSSLVLRNLSSEQEGLYTCTASNAHGLASKVYSLKVTPPNGTAPFFPTPSENVTLAAGRSLLLLCKAEGEKPMTYKWYNQDEKEIKEDDTQLVYVRNWENDSSLVLRNLSSEQEGLYTCTASNAHGLASKVYFLNVTPSRDGNDTDIDQGNRTSRLRHVKVLKYTSKSVTFYITTSGPVKYIEAQYREGKLASNATTVRLYPVPGNIYVIDNLLPSGLFSFKFRTVPPESSDWSWEYNVTLLPKAPEIILQIIDDRSVKLQWFTSTDDLLRETIDRHQIKYFSVEMVDGNNWTTKNCSVTTEVPTCVGSSYTIWGLERTIFYQIEVRAHTEAGYSEPWMQKVYLP